MPKLIDMARTPAWGLTLRLDDGGLTKLGMTDLPQVGSTISATIEGVITEVTMNDSDEGSNRSVNIQVQKIGLEPKESASRAEKLYPAKAKEA